MPCCLAPANSSGPLLGAFGWRHPEGQIVHDIVLEPRDNAPARPPQTAAGVFTTTHWSIVLAAGEAKSAQSHEALEKLCCAYWYPLYAYVRRKGYGVHDAQDLTQEFF